MIDVYSLPSFVPIPIPSLWVVEWSMSGSGRWPGHSSFEGGAIYPGPAEQHYRQCYHWPLPLWVNTKKTQWCSKGWAISSSVEAGCICMIEIFNCHCIDLLFRNRNSEYTLCILLHERSVDLSSITNPKPTVQGNHPNACSGNSSNLAKDISRLDPVWQLGNQLKAVVRWPLVFLSWHDLIS